LGVDRELIFEYFIQFGLFGSTRQIDKVLLILPKLLHKDAEFIESIKVDRKFTDVILPSKFPVNFDRFNKFGIFMQQLWQNGQTFVDLSRGTKKPKLDEIFKNEFSIVYRKISKRKPQTKFDIIQMSGPL
jgi:uncharacterized protein YifE (UPF0438 family)